MAGDKRETGSNTGVRSIDLPYAVDDRVVVTQRNKTIVSDDPCNTCEGAGRIDYKGLSYLCPSSLCHKGKLIKRDITIKNAGTVNRVYVALKRDSIAIWFEVEADDGSHLDNIYADEMELLCED